MLSFLLFIFVVSLSVILLALSFLVVCFVIDHFCRITLKEVATVYVAIKHPEFLQSE